MHQSANQLTRAKPLQVSGAARRRMRWLVATFAGGALALLSLLPSPAYLVWNFSPSVRPGLYLVEAIPWRLRDLVSVRPTGSTLQALDDYGVLPSQRVLIKRVAAVARDIVCRSDRTILVNGAAVATALSSLPDGRRLPVWQGCIALSDGQVFLLADHPSSFDGRYFGPSNAKDILAPLRPIWLPFPPSGTT